MVLVAGDSNEKLEPPRTRRITKEFLCVPSCPRWLKPFCPFWGADLNSLHTSTDFPISELEKDQLFWHISLGLDLSDRSVLEAEVLIWRIARQKSATLTRHSLNQGDSDLFT